MDLPTCPACGQSVLDDEAEDCPFCGASMSGKPSARPAKPAAAPAKAATAAKPSAGKPPSSTGKPAAAGGRPAAKAAPPKPKDDDPFAIETAVGEKAITLSPQPLKGRAHAVKCPMCETTGYASSKVAGHEVRCANPKCLVPIFTAPALPKEEPPPEPKRSPASAIVLGMSALVGVALVGFGIWFFVLGGSRRDTPPSPPPIVQTDLQPGDSEKKTEKTADEKKKSERPVASAPTLDDLQRDALAAMIDASRIGETTTSRKPLQVRLTAEAYAASGDIEGARVQMERFNVVRPSIPFYRVFPLVEIAWQQLQNGDEQAAKATIDEAQQYMQRIPNSGRDAWDAVTTLATALAATGRTDDAVSLARQYDNSEERPRSRFWAAAFIVRQRGTFDLDQYLAEHPWRDWAHPRVVAVTSGLSGRGRWDEALAWATAQADEADRIDSLTELADDLARQDGAADRLPLLDSAAENLSPAGKARIYARVAARLAQKGNTAAADNLLQKATAALDAVPDAQPMALADMKQVYQFDLPDGTALRRASLAMAEIARSQAALGRQDDAWNSLQTALTLARGTAPSVPAVQSFLQEIEGLGTSGLQSRLQQELNLPSADRARIAANQYRKKVDDLLQAANHRMALQSMLLSEAARWELRGKIWEEIESRASAGDVNERENWFETAVPVILAEEFRSAGDADQAQEAEAAISGTRADAVREGRLRQQTAGLVAAGKLQQAATDIERSRLPEFERNRWGMRLACRLVREDKLESAVQFIRAFRDPIFAEDALDMVAAQATRLGQGPRVWQHVQNAGLRPTDKIAYLRGFVVGAEHALASTN